MSRGIDGGSPPGLVVAIATSHWVMRMMRLLHYSAGGERDLDAVDDAHIIKSRLVWGPGVANESNEQG